MDDTAGPPAAPQAETPPTWIPPARPTAPGPAPGIEYAGFWVRVGAYLIDGVPFFILAMILLFMMMGSMFSVFRDIGYPPQGLGYDSPEYQAYNRLLTERMSEAMGSFYPTFGLFQLASIAYFVGFWTWRGQTPGMMLLGLRVARDVDGTPPGFGRSVLRYLGYLVSWFALFIGFIWVAFDSRKQGWHDKIAGTVVVRRSG
jgi:uncharacterized RDD family membrane protein YckC